MSKVTLNGQPALCGDKVYDLVHGPGRIVSVEMNKIQVSFGSRGRRRQYNEAGVTGKNCYRTLYFRPPAVIEFPKDETRAAKLDCAIKDVVEIFNSLTEQGCNTQVDCGNCEPETPCEKWQ